MRKGRPKNRRLAPNRSDEKGLAAQRTDAERIRDIATDQAVRSAGLDQPRARESPDGVGGLLNDVARYVEVRARADDLCAKGADQDAIAS